MDAWSKHAKLYETAFASKFKIYCQDALSLASSKLPAIPSSILGIACGTGAMTFSLVQLGYNVVATDYAQGMLDSLESNLLFQSSLITLVQSDGENLAEFDNDSFDAITSSFGIALFHDRISGWKAALQKLKPNGTLISLWWSGDFIPLQLADFLKNEFTNAEIIPHPCSSVYGFKKELESVGFVDVDSYKISHDFVYPVGKIFYESLWDNPFFKSLSIFNRDLVDAKIFEFFGKKSLVELLEQPIIIKASAIIATARK